MTILWDKIGFIKKLHKRKLSEFDNLKSKSSEIRKDAEKTIVEANKVIEEYKQPLPLEKLMEMVGEPIWIQVLDRPDLSSWHFIVNDLELGIVAKDSLGVYEAGRLSGCYFDIEHGHNYGVNWMAYYRKPKQERDLEG